MRFPFVRTAIHLSLVVALAIQPMLAHAAMAACATVGFTCQGCGCCEVEEAEASCGCCGGTSESVPEQAPSGGCCDHESSGSAASKRARDSQGPVQPKASSTQRASLRAFPGEATTIERFGALEACSCEPQPQPLQDGSSQRASSESRPTIAVGYLAFDASLLGHVPSNGAERRNADLPAPQHAAQVLLSVWRL